jgi:phosphoglycerate dehydrogenase-like enzyme
LAVEQQTFAGRLLFEYNVAMALSVHLLSPPRDPAALRELHDRLDPGIHLTTGADLPSPPNFDILIAGRPERAHVTASPRLSALITPWAGVPDSTRDLMREFPEIAVHNLHHNALPVAEHACALLLAAARCLVPMDRALRAHDWRPRYQPNPGILLAGRLALVLGYGAIGREVARLCRGLGMDVAAIRRHVTHPGEQVDGVALYPPESLHDLLPRATAVLVCLPHTPHTTGLLGAAELALLPSASVLVNVGRGPIVDQQALYHALREQRIHSAGLDVWYNYPPDEASRANTPPADYPFEALDNVVMSPHRAGGSTQTDHLRMIHLAELLNAAARGQEMPNRVDLEAGY